MRFAEVTFHFDAIVGFFGSVRNESSVSSQMAIQWTPQIVIEKPGKESLLQILCILSKLFDF